MGRLNNKVALVFGAGSIQVGLGNGKATSIAFAREGASVIAVDRNLEAAEETARVIAEEGGRCDALAADVTDAGSVRAAVQRCVEIHGRIDILQNNVGMAALGGPVEMDEAVWDESLRVNLKGLFLTCKHVLPVMEAQGAGAIINISSIASIRWLGTAYISYASAKAGVNQFTQAIALQYARKGIRANAILPGMMDTPTARVALGATFSDEADLVVRRNEMCPTGRMGDAWDIAWASVFLASDEAKYITGISLPVDGGMTAKVS
ncbi:MAG: dehydrogenase [Alphaproteobacteria bacterium]|nr:MAG: dehydrogenase [Alphaproteobacteria bacterium]